MAEDHSQLATWELKEHANSETFFIKNPSCNQYLAISPYFQVEFVDKTTTETSLPLWHVDVLNEGEDLLTGFSSDLIHSGTSPLLNKIYDLSFSQYA